MKRFHFPLERVRNWRLEQVDVEETRLQQLYAELRRTERARTEIAEESDRSRRAVLSQSAVMAEELSFLEAAREYAAGQIDQLLRRERALAPRISEQRQRVLDAHRRFQLLDGLRDKALVAWRSARDKEQEQLAAELFLARYNREIAAAPHAEQEA